MARLARPQDVTRAIALLADGEESSFVNGVTLSVDGSWTGQGVAPPAQALGQRTHQKGPRRWPRAFQQLPFTDYIPGSWGVVGAAFSRTNPCLR